MDEKTSTPGTPVEPAASDTPVSEPDKKEKVQLPQTAGTKKIIPAQRKKFIRITIAALLTAATASGSYLLFFKPCVNYYNKIVRTADGLLCCYELTEAQVRNRVSSYQVHRTGLYDFTFNKWRNFNWKNWRSYLPFESAMPHRIVIVDCDLSPRQINEYSATVLWDENYNILPEGISREVCAAVSIIDFTYNADRSLRSETGKRLIRNPENGKMIEETVWKALVLDPASAMPGVPAFDQLVMFVDKYGKPLRIPGKSGAELLYAGVNFQKRDGKYMTEICWIAPWSKFTFPYAANIGGAHKIVTVTSPSGDLERAEFYKFNFAEGKFIKAENCDGCHAIVYSYDRNGNLISGEYFDKEDKPAVVDGHKFMEFKYDTFGNRIEGICWSDRDRTAPAGDKSGSHRVKYIITNGRQTGFTAYLHNNTGRFQNSSVAILRRQFNAAGLPVAECYFDRDEKPAVLEDGVHRSELIYDKNEPLRVVEFRQKSLPGQSGFIGYPGIKALRIKLNEDGDVIEEAFFQDEECSKLAGVPGTVSRSVFSYFAKGKLRSKCNYDLNGAPAVDCDGICRQENFLAPDFGEIVKTVLLSCPGKGIRNSGNILRAEKLFGPGGVVIEEKFFSDIKGKVLTNNPLGIARIVRTFNAGGKLTSETFFDCKNAPATYDNGIHRAEYFPDPMTGKMVRMTLYAHPDRGIDGKKKIMRIEYFYDDRERIISKRYFAADGSPAAAEDREYKHVKAFRKDTAYHGRTNNRSRVTLYLLASGKDNALIRMEHHYSPDGKMIKLINHYDPRLRKDNVVRSEAVYDPATGDVTTAFFGPDASPAVNARGIHRSKINYFPGSRKIRRIENSSLPGSHLQEGPGIMRAVIINDKNGNAVSEEYFDAQGNPAYIPGNINKIIRVFKADNKVLREVKTGKDINNYPGVCRIEYIYNASGRVAKINYFDAQGKPAPGADGCTAEEFFYSENGTKVRSRSSFDAGSTFENNKSVRKIEYLYYPGGNIRFRKFYGADGKAVPHLNALTEEFIFDKRDNSLVKVIRYWIPGQGRNKNIEYEVLSFNRDSSVRCRETFSGKGKPAMNRRGIFRCDYSYPKTNVSVTTFYGKNIDNKTNVSKIEKRQSGNDTEYTFYGKDIFGTDICRHFVRYHNGEIVCRIFMDASGKPFVNHEGVWKEELKRDGKLIIEQRLYSLPGFGLNNNPRIQLIVRNCDRHGNTVSYQYFADHKGEKLIGDKNGIAVSRFSYDDSQREIERTFFSPDMKPAANSDGIHRRVRSGFNGKAFQEVLYSLPGAGVFKHAGVMQLLIKYDASGKVVEESCFADLEKNIPAKNSDGVFRTLHRYNADGRKSELRNVDSENNPAADNNGICRQELLYGPDGKISVLILHSIPGIGIWNNCDFLSVRRQIDADGRIIDEKYFGADGKPAINQNGVSRVETRYAPGSRKVQQEIWYSIPGTGIWWDKRIMKLERSLNSAGNIIEERFFNASGKPECNASGISVGKMFYTRGGKVRSGMLLSGNNLENRKNVTRIEIKYAPNGKIIQKIIQGKNIDGKPGVFKIEYRFDANGRPESTRIFDRHGNMIKK